MRVLIPVKGSRPEQIVLPQIGQDEARIINAEIPVVAGPRPSAAPFRFRGSEADRQAAEKCLTAAVYYEAGDDRLGQQAVAQVILNRLRHPAFPASVCGVVFEGSDRSTGCQFTFTCDGSLDRVPSQAAWKRAQDVARKALDGFVYKDVGLSTHYHTDWVVPYWQGSLDKIAIVHSQIFYRWRGWWGTPGAFRSKVFGDEHLDPRLAPPAADSLAAAPATGGDKGPDTIEPANVDPGRTLTSLTIDGVRPDMLRGQTVVAKDEIKHSYELKLDPAAYPGTYAIVAYTICRAKLSCLVVGWLPGDRAAGSNSPSTRDAAQRPSFIYEKRPGDSAGGRPLWNCDQMQRADPLQCLKLDDVVRVAGIF